MAPDGRCACAEAQLSDSGSGLVAAAGKSCFKVHLPWSISATMMPASLRSQLWSQSVPLVRPQQLPEKMRSRTPSPADRYNYSARLVTDTQAQAAPVSLLRSRTPSPEPVYRDVAPAKLLLAPKRKDGKLLDPSSRDICLAPGGICACAEAEAAAISRDDTTEAERIAANACWRTNVPNTMFQGAEETPAEARTRVVPQPVNTMAMQPIFVQPLADFTLDQSWATVKTEPVDAPAGKKNRRKRTATKLLLAEHLRSLETHDHRCILLLKKINRLGFQAADILREHFSEFGVVADVLLSNKHEKDADAPLPQRLRPSPMGWIRFESASAAAAALAVGEEQTVAEATILVRAFESRSERQMPSDEEKGFA